MTGESASYTVSVRALCEFAARRGDLDLRFTPAPTALEGIDGHARAASRRGADYERELPLEGRHAQLRIRGRADGYDPARNRLEEIKTHRRGAAPVPVDQLAMHRAQARVYGWLLCQARGLAQVELAVVYLDVDSGRETPLLERRDAAWLAAFAGELCERYMRWAGAQRAHRDARDEALGRLAFPYPAFREGQRRLAEAVYRANVAGRCLLAQAPTGIGKTIATLFPALRAMPGQGLDKLFYLTARTTGRQLALDALQRLAGRPDASPLRVLELVAREKACEHPDRACHPQSCPLAAGFYDRLPAARQAAASAGWLDRRALRRIALDHSVCPYFLGQEMVCWSDVVVGDYNHYFDGAALLYARSAQERWRVSLLVDEAHNLVDRARRMHTAELRLADLACARRGAPSGLRRPLGALYRCWSAMARAQREDYRVLDDLPAGLVAALQKAVAALARHFAVEPVGNDSRLLRWYFDLLRFERVAAARGPHALCESRLEGGPAGAPHGSTICVRNVVPAPLLSAHWAAARSATLFSATLAPPVHFLELLGLPASTACIDLPPPFSMRQLVARVVPGVSTRYRDRERTLDAVVAVLARQFREQPGNYLAFFSSFEYLQRAVERLAQHDPGIDVWFQQRGMDESQREAFVARFTPESRGVGFAVLGGAFGEGVDLPGARLIGAFVVTLGLPQSNPVNEQIRKRIDQCLGRGYEHTYLYPGVRKVVQAAGRVIRSPEDRGVVYLIDDRYRRDEVRRLLPQWWALHEG